MPSIPPGWRILKETPPTFEQAHFSQLTRLALVADIGALGSCSARRLGRPQSPRRRLDVPLYGEA
jgi:hypothetical protein